MKVCGGGRCGQKGGIDGVREVENVSAKSTISPSDISWGKEGFNVHVIGKRERNGWNLVAILNGIEPLSINQEPFHPSLDERNHNIGHKEMCINDKTWLDGENVPIKASKKHSVKKHHHVIFDDVNHPFGNVVGKKSSSEPFSREHARSLAWNVKDLGKVVERKNDFKTVIFDGEKDLANVGVIKMDLKNVGVKIEDEDAALVLLVSLPPLFESFVSSFVVGKDTITLEDSCIDLEKAKIRLERPQVLEQLLLKTTYATWAQNVNYFEWLTVLKIGIP
uniref:Retrovirus-related Pol polyprotein from transposon TNT 1-94 n=1 Tax=Tanacetum cinerariifolium TaxID=118510 RepID=A0A6L2NSY6_TANCI|nr:retrovirus-related Pol polyprotein from transposon TNT 1-94 [Tanacetum cinerariifolium]